MHSLTLSLDTIPVDVLEHIAFFAGTATVLGPPSAMVALLCTNRKIHSCLSIASNHHLYARIFSCKFDCGPAKRRLNPECTTAAALSGELQRRFFYLKRVRTRLDSVIKPFQAAPYGGDTLQQILWIAYLMMLENDGKNEQQLRDYARMDLWLNDYFFDDYGASYAKSSINVNLWPSHNEQTSLAMWTFWFLLRPDDYRNDRVLFLNVTNTLKLFALAANQYPLCSPSWIDFIPNSRTSKPDTLVHYTKTIQLTPPSLGAPAILSFLTLANALPFSSQTITHNILITPSPFSMSACSGELECEWARCVSLGKTDYDKVLSGAFRPGSLEGVWEGVMTYSEFTAYAALLSGAPPPILQKCLVPQHRQTWKLREYHFSTSDIVYSTTGIELGNRPMSPGDPSKAHIPRGTRIREASGGLEVREPGRNMLYRRALVGSTPHLDDQSRVQDVIVIGEGHSAWGQFSILGRVRPCDGLISLSKDYVDGDRGKWLYRGYLIGDANGSLAGRWRDTLSPAEVPGYEGSFVLGRRR